jgi:hypothetical protein
VPARVSHLAGRAAASRRSIPLLPAHAVTLMHRPGSAPASPPRLSSDSLVLCGVCNRDQHCYTFHTKEEERFATPSPILQSSNLELPSFPPPLQNPHPLWCTILHKLSTTMSPASSQQSLPPLWCPLPFTDLAGVIRSDREREEMAYLIAKTWAETSTCLFRRPREEASFTSSASVPPFGIAEP